MNSTELDWLINSGWTFDLSECLTASSLSWRMNASGIDLVCRLRCDYNAYWSWQLCFRVNEQTIGVQYAKEAYMSPVQAAKEVHAVRRTWFLASEILRKQLRLHPDSPFRLACGLEPGSPAT